MDPLTVALCALGAAGIAGMGQDNVVGTLPTLLLFAGFYGIYRATQNKAALALVAAPALAWLLGQLWVFVPRAIVSFDFERAHPTLHALPNGLGGLLVIVALIVAITASESRRRLGVPLLAITVAAAVIGLLFRIAPDVDGRESALAVMTNAIAAGWGPVAHVLLAVCFFVIGLGGVAVLPLPRRGGVLVGAIGAALLAALLAGIPARLPSQLDGTLLFFAFLVFVAWVLCAVGFGAVARAGGRGAAWAAVGLASFQILGLVPAISLLERSSSWGLAFVLATPFGFAGFGIAALGWKDAPLRGARSVLAAMFFAAALGAVLSWLGIFVDASRLMHVEDPFAILGITTRPLATLALSGWSAYLLLLASVPPSLPALQQQPHQPMMAPQLPQQPQYAPQPPQPPR